MYFSRSYIAAALVGFAAAQSGSIAASETMAGATSASAIPLSSALPPAPGMGTGMVNTHVIQVGGPNGSIAFFPNNVQANVGDLVQFQFHPKNHSVAQSTFDQPCVPIQNVMSNMTNAFFSGYMPTTAAFGSTTDVLTYTIRVQDTKPVWFYCTQAKHCQGGMVGAINAPTSGNKTMQAFIALAAQAPENITPGQVGGGSGSGTGTANPSGGSGGTGTGSGTEATGGAASGTGANPAQQTTNSAPSTSRQSFLGLGAAAVAAFLVL